jgi:cysteinyl-tRNA synthetase
MGNLPASPNAITALQDLTKKANQLSRSKTEFEVLLSVLKVYDDFFAVLGLKVDISPLSKEDKEVYKNWQQARVDKDFAAADKYRAILQEKGIM